MVKKYITKYLSYTVIFALLAIAEKSLGIYGISIGFLFSLLFCRERIFIGLPCFFLAENLIYFSVRGLIYSSAAPIVYILIYFVHSYKKLRYGFGENALLILLSLAPYIGFNASSETAAIVRVALSAAAAVAVGYIGVAACYPVIIRGLRYKPTSGELFCMGIIVGIASIGLGRVELFNVKLYYLFLGFMLLFLRATDRPALLPFGIASAAGIVLGCGEIYPLCIISVSALVTSGIGDGNRFIAGIASCMAFFIGMLFFAGKIDLFALAPYAAGVLIACCIPQRATDKLLAPRRGADGRFALRSVVNRDRENVSERIDSLSTAFCEMRDILCDEGDYAPDISVVRDSVCAAVCAECPYCVKCVERFDVRAAVERVISNARRNGKATMLDVSVSLGENCKKLNILLNSVNDGLERYEKLLEKKKSVEQGREMIIAQMGGVADLLGAMARSVKAGLSFDTELERALTERLAKANIIANDVTLYKGENGAEATVVVRLRDVEKPALAAIVSDVIGIKMNEFSRKREINDMVGVSFCRAPKYKIMYGESVLSQENRCGDTRQALKIGKNKVMFILSDGMGTGRSAHMTANNVICLLETFYRAGFDHKTIFTSVAGLLSLRTREDFSALDVAVVDLASGEADFIKQGGRESYIVSEGGCEIIEGGTLPMGILPDSVPKVERRKINSDETVILLSDGVADALGEEEIRAVTLTAGLHNPKTIADEIVKNAAAKRGKSTDDMTAMVMRLVEA